jgi:hypothetical protein
MRNRKALKRVRMFTMAHLNILRSVYVSPRTFERSVLDDE